MPRRATFVSFGRPLFWHALCVPALCHDVRCSAGWADLRLLAVSCIGLGLANVGLTLLGYHGLGWAVLGSHRSQRSLCQAVLHGFCCQTGQGSAWHGHYCNTKLLPAESMITKRRPQPRQALAVGCSKCTGMQTTVMHALPLGLAACQILCDTRRVTFVQ